MSLVRRVLGAWASGVPDSGNSYVGDTPTSAAAYQERDGARLLWYADKYWLLGGWWPDSNAEWGTDVTTNGVWSSTDLETWTQNLAHDASPPTSGAGARWRRRHTYGAHVWDGAVWVVGGDANDGSPWPSDVWRAEDPGDVDGWERIAASSAWGAKYLPMTCIFRGELHVMGGFSQDDDTASSEHWKSADGVTWTQLPDMPFARASVFDPVVWTVGGVERFLVVCGGSSGVLSGRTLHNDVWVWNGSAWTQTTASAPWSARDWVATCRYDGALWVLTGASPGNAGGAYRSTDLGRSWSLVSEAPWAGSHADAMCADGPRGIVIASGNGHGTDVYTLESA